MAAPVTQTDIVNAAAALLGSTERVSSLDTSGNLARHALAVWDMTARRLLADHPWNFAIEEAALNPGVVPASGRFERAFALPVNCLRLLSIGDERAWRYPEDSAIEGGHLLTDAEAPLHARFISSRYIADCGRWPPHLADAMAAALAELLAEPLTGKRSIAQAMAQRAYDALARAKRVDGLESQRSRHAQPTRRSTWLGSLHSPYNRWSR